MCIEPCISRKKRGSTPTTDESVPDERVSAPVKACCTGRVQRILEELTDRSVISEVTLPRKNETEKSQGVSETNGPVLDVFRVQTAVSSAR